MARRKALLHAQRQDANSSHAFTSTRSQLSAREYYNARYEKVDKCHRSTTLYADVTNSHIVRLEGLWREYCDTVDIDPYYTLKRSMEGRIKNFFHWICNNYSIKKISSVETYWHQLRNRALILRSLFWVFMHTVLLSFYCALKATADLYESMLFEITWLIVVLVWGTITILKDRASDGQEPPGDNGWAFGQVIAVVLLFLPFLSFVEVVYDAVKAFPEPPWPRGVLLGTPRGESNPPQHYRPALPYEGFEKCGWYRNMTLMVYLLSLVVAGDVLYVFPFSQVTSELSIQATVTLTNYSQWFALNVGIVWLFAINALQWPVCNQRMLSRKVGRLASNDLLGLMLPNQSLDIYRSVNFYKGSKESKFYAGVGVTVSIAYYFLTTGLQVSK